MNGGVTIPDKDTARALNDLARHKAIVRILSDIRMDMEICEIEGWDKNEYLNLIRQLLNSIGDKTMDDSISRQGALDAVDTIGHIATMPDGDKCIRRSAVKYTLSMLPPVQPEQKTALWIIRKWGDNAKCSNCGKTFSDVYDMEKYDGYCRFCGCKMVGFKGEQKDENNRIFA